MKIKVSSRLLCSGLPAQGWVEGLVKISGPIIKLAGGGVRLTRLPDPSSTCAERLGTGCRRRSSGLAVGFEHLSEPKGSKVVRRTFLPITFCCQHLEGKIAAVLLPLPPPSPSPPPFFPCTLKFFLYACHPYFGFLHC